jgi:hypothetical protein
MSRSDCEHCTKHYDGCPYVRPPYTEEVEYYWDCLVHKAENIQNKKDFIDINSLLKVKELYKKAPYDELRWLSSNVMENLIDNIDEIQKLLTLDTTVVKPEIR